MKQVTQRLSHTLSVDQVVTSVEEGITVMADPDPDPAVG